MTSSLHIPVLLKETIEGLSIKSDGIYIDLTLGRGGHSKEILSRLSNSGLLIGVDKDEVAIKEAKKNLDCLKKPYILIQTSFENLEEVLETCNAPQVDGILMDLGVSSPQFDVGERGFSYRLDGPLDMRMDLSSSLTAKKIVNEYSLNELNRIIKEYGEEKYSYQIARNIVKAREEKPIETTLELVEIIKRSKPYKELAKKGHPAKQTFQALRIRTNNELEVLRKTLPLALKALKAGGRLAVISFHSLEDRIVKEEFRKLTYQKGDRISLPSDVEPLHYRLVNKHLIVASEEELKINNRAKSAKLRIIERID